MNMGWKSPYIWNMIWKILRKFSTIPYFYRDRKFNFENPAFVSV